MSEPIQPSSRYRLVARLGSGGMAEVYLALSESPHGFSKLQVLKMLRPDLNAEDRTDFLRMFEDEGRLAARLNHPNIVQSHDVGFECDQPFIAMEYLDGQTLSRVHERLWQTEARQAWGLELFPLSQVLDALEYAHHLSDYDGSPLHIVHRDVSPQNIFVTYTGHTKLVDFGIAKTLESYKTRAGVVKGKVPYMSPEQVLGTSIDHRTDLFSVGVILWETIARRPMHDNLPMYEILRRLVHGELPEIREVAPDAPQALVDILKRALAVSPIERYPNAGAFREDLDAFIESEGRVDAREVGKLVSELFASERREVGEAIRRAVAGPVDGRATTGEPDTLRLPPTLTMLTSRTFPVESIASTSGKPLDTEPFEQTQTAPPVHRSMPRLSSQKKWVSASAALVGLLVLALTVRGLWPGVEDDAPALSSAAVAGVNGPDLGVEQRSLQGAELVLDELPHRSDDFAKRHGRAIPEATPTAVEDAKLVAVRIKVEPSHASLVLDGEPIGTGVYDGSQPRQAQSRTLVVSAPGYVTRSRALVFQRDIDLELSLARVPAVKPEPKPVRAPERARAERPKTRAAVRKSSESGDLYDVDLPPPRRPTAPPLDTADPW